MFLRVDKLAIEMPQPTEPDPAAAAAVQELLGGRFGEMSTLNNYLAQSFNMRDREAIRPFYEIVANIAAEELGHVELVSASINLLLSGPKEGKDGIDPLKTNLEDYAVKGLRMHAIDTGQAAKPVNSAGLGWDGNAFVFSSGNLVLDMLHNFFLENGARTQKLRVYEMTNNPAARAMLGYLFVRGGVHAVAYGKALEKLTGVNMNGMLPIPKIPNADFPEAKRFMDQDNHTKLYRFSVDDYNNMAAIWNGAHPDGGECVVVDGPPEGGPLADLPAAPESFAPEAPGAMAELYDMAKFLTKKAGMPSPDRPDGV